jgi:hypothetical protein
MAAATANRNLGFRIACMQTLERSGEGRDERQQEHQEQEGGSGGGEKKMMPHQHSQLEMEANTALLPPVLRSRLQRTHDVLDGFRTFSMVPSIGVHATLAAKLADTLLT